jgi:hypothetical protein
MEQVGPQRAVSDGLLDIGGRRRDEAGAHFAAGRATEARDAPLFDDTQECTLAGGRESRDRVEVERAPPGQLEPARPGDRGVGEGAAFVAEQLRLDQRFRQSRTVHGDEGFAPARA